MPKLPRISGGEIVRTLQHLGFERIRQNGSHMVMRKGHRGCVVPLHAEVKVGTLSGILRQADVSAEEFIGAL